MKRSKKHCTKDRNKPRCDFTGRICDDDYAKICEEYRSDEGLYECPHCNRNGLKALNYGSDDNPEIVWECVRCGAELWYCESVDEMKKRCEEIKKEW